ncbi:uncharacterized protein LOC102801354 [Saccoglossus kowalevskii]
MVLSYLLVSCCIWTEVLSVPVSTLQKVPAFYSGAGVSSSVGNGNGETQEYTQTQHGKQPARHPAHIPGEASHSIDKQGSGSYSLPSPIGIIGYIPKHDLPDHINVKSNQPDCDTLKENEDVLYHSSQPEQKLFEQDNPITLSTALFGNRRPTGNKPEVNSTRERFPSISDLPAPPTIDHMELPPIAPLETGIPASTMKEFPMHHSAIQHFTESDTLGEFVSNKKFPISVAGALRTMSDAKNHEPTYTSDELGPIAGNHGKPAAGLPDFAPQHLLPLLPVLLTISDGSGGFASQNITSTPRQTVNNVLTQAQWNYEFQNSEIANPFQYSVRQTNNECYVISRILNINTSVSRVWFIVVVNSNGKEIYFNSCLPDEKIIVRPGYTVKVVLLPTKSHRLPIHDVSQSDTDGVDDGVDRE